MQQEAGVWCHAFCVTCFCWDGLWALGFGPIFPVRRGPCGATDCLSGDARQRRTPHPRLPSGRRAGHTPPSAVSIVLGCGVGAMPRGQVHPVQGRRHCGGMRVGWGGDAVLWNICNTAYPCSTSTPVASSP